MFTSRGCMQGDPSIFPMPPMGLPPATVRRLHWDGRPRCKHRGVVCKAIRAYSRCPRWVYRRLLCGGCTGTGALDVNIEGLYARRSEHIPDVPDGSTAGYCAAVALGRAPSMFSLRYIAPSSFFLSPNAHLPWRTFQCQDTSKGQSSKTTYKCLNREKPLLFADSRGRDGLGPHHAEHTPSSPI